MNRCACVSSVLGKGEMPAVLALVAYVKASCTGSGSSRGSQLQEGEAGVPGVAPSGC